MKRLLQSALGYLGYKLVRKQHSDLLYQHDYGDGGYQRYRDIQIFHNKRKIESIWADDATIQFICDYLKNELVNVGRGLCHGSRNGYEQRRFSEILKCQVIGTDISDTAANYPNSVQWDFHEVKADWIGQCSFVYSNSLDQAFDPRKALETWVDQLTPDGMVFIEHTMAHSPAGASEMDPFGAHPMVMPYLFFEWGRGRYRLRDILHPPQKKHGTYEVWIFVLVRESSHGPV